MKRAWLFALAISACSSQAAAQASYWARVREPGLDRAEKTLRAVERHIDLLKFAEARNDRSVRDLFRAVIAMLELGGAEELPDPRLRFLLGWLLNGDAFGSPSRATERAEQSRRILERFLAEDPDSPLAADAFWYIAIDWAKLGNRDKEFDAYGRALELEWRPERRATILLNRAESRMLRKDFRGAIREYRASALHGDPDEQALAYWGLGVTFERSGDLPSAIESITEAQRLQRKGRQVLESPGVFFVPPYEIQYYKGLGALASARKAENLADTIADLDAAIVHLTAYLVEAERDGTPWVDNAKQLTAIAERDLERARKKLKSLPARERNKARPKADDDETL